MSEIKVLLTGSTGFLGQALRKHFDGTDYKLVCVSRTFNEFSDFARVINSKTDWDECLDGCDVVVHAAASNVSHQLDPGSQLEELREINSRGTLRLASEAARKGIKRFIFISSIKVMGENSAKDRPFEIHDEPLPTQFYGMSKYEAEQGLRDLGLSTEMEIVIIRPALVYGEGVKGNLYTLMKWLNKGMVLPLGLISNARSLVSVRNLIDLIVTCMSHPSAANETFLVSDGNAVSTTKLLKIMRRNFHKKSILIPISEYVLVYILSLFRRGDLARRLCSSLEVDISYTKRVLNWAPPFDFNDEISLCVQDFKNNNL
jgi:nucleoside-diphosphate-sugar epimerase